LNKNEEIQAQSEELTNANKILTELNREVLEQKEEIQTQSEELSESYGAISQINQTLEEKIADRTAALRRAFHELDTFFYRSSHDFRRPLTTFMGLAQVAKVTVREPAALELFQKVDETARHLDRMVKKLQAVSDVGALELTEGETSVQELFDHALIAFREDLTQKAITVNTRVEATEKFVSYPLLLTIILDNLVENALQFSGHAEPSITMKGSIVESKIIIEIKDNGRGIDPLYHSKVFDMYFRATETSKGNGLGLFIVKKAVERLGGGVSFESEKYIGSTFTFWFTPVSFAL
jgi:signal transduction histidine kinase